MKSADPSKNLPNSGSKSGDRAKNIPRRGRPLGAVDRHGRAHRAQIRLGTTAWRSFCVAFGRRLDQLMAERDVAATELAAAIGLHEQSIHILRRGERMPHMVTLAALSQALSCSLVDLLPEQAHGAGGVM
jgi:DNA-binding Xre family transcriptional regulator